MENARVVIFEDRERIRQVVRENLEYDGHTVVAEGVTLDHALSVVDRMAAGELAADVILLDGNLTPNMSEGEDARRIAEHIRQAGIASKVLGFSLNTMYSYGVEVYADPGKDIQGVLTVIREL